MTVGTTTMQREWHRRQTQRNVIVLLGLLTVFTPAPAAALAKAVVPAVGELIASVAAEPVAPATATHSARPQRTQERYWRAVGKCADGRARVGLRQRPEPSALSLLRRPCLARYSRPPTR